MRLKFAQCDTFLLWDDTSPLFGPGNINYLENVLAQICLKLGPIWVGKTANVSIQRFYRRRFLANPSVHVRVVLPRRDNNQAQRYTVKHANRSQVKADDFVMGMSLAMNAPHPSTSQVQAAQPDRNCKRDRKDAK
jgi:hypothetical protein